MIAINGSVNRAMKPATATSNARLIAACTSLSEADDISSSGWWPIAVACTRLKSMPDTPGST